jgi:hypothetical protein
VESDLSPSRPTPLVKLRCSSEFLSDRASNDIGFRCSPLVLGVARWTPGFSHGRLPCHARKLDRVSSLELPPSFRERRPPSGRRPRIRPRSSPRALAPPVRFLPLQRLPAQGSGIKSDRASHTRPPTPPGFLNLLTSSSAPSLLALFHARSAHGVRPSELSSSRAAVRRLRRRCPLVVGTSLRPAREPADPSRVPKHRANTSQPP